jgi:hypothetical protein
LLFEFIVRDKTASLIQDSPRPFLSKALMSILQMFQRTGLTDAAGTSLTADLAATILETPHSLRVLYKLSTTSSLLLTIQACQILILIFNNSSSCLIRESWRICIDPALFLTGSRPALLPLARELALQMNVKNAEKPYQSVAARILDDLEAHSYAAIAHGISWLSTQRNYDIVAESDVCPRFLRDLVAKAFHIPTDFASPATKAPASAMQALALFVWPPEPQRDAVSVEEGAKDKWKARVNLLLSVAPDFVTRAIRLFEAALSEDLWKKYSDGHQKYCAELAPELPPSVPNGTAPPQTAPDASSLNKRLHRFALSTQLTMAMNCIASLVLSDDVVSKLKGTDCIDKLTKTTQALFEGTKATTAAAAAAAASAAAAGGGLKPPVSVEEWQKRREETCSWTACWAHFMNRGRDEGWPLHPMQYAALLVQIRTAPVFGVIHTDESRLRISNEIKKVGNSCYSSAKYSLAVYATSYSTIQVYISIFKLDLSSPYLEIFFLCASFFRLEILILIVFGIVKVILSHWRCFQTRPVPTSASHCLAIAPRRFCR